MSFKICDNKGFHITFDNGITVSVQFGGGNYGSNYNYPIGKEKDSDGMAAYEAEVAVFDHMGKWIGQEFPGAQDDGILPYVNAEKVLEVLNWAAKYDPLKPTGKG